MHVEGRQRRRRYTRNSEAWSSVRAGRAIDARPSRSPIRNGREVEIDRNPRPAITLDRGPFAPLPVDIGCIDRVGRGFVLARTMGKMGFDCSAADFREAIRRKRVPAQSGDRIISAQREAIFGACRHHPIGLADPLESQIVIITPDVARAAIEADRARSSANGRGIQAGHEAPAPPLPHSRWCR